jgi:hypothetical protein
VRQRKYDEIEMRSVSTVLELPNTYRNVFDQLEEAMVHVVNRHERDCIDLWPDVKERSDL